MIFQGMVLKLPFEKHLECNLCDKDCYYKQLKRLEQENEKLKEKLEKIEKYISECCHRFSSNNKNLCFGCEYDHEVCDYSKILEIIRGEQMNEIEKLYENAGVEKQYYSFKSSCGKTYTWELNENVKDKYNIMCFIREPEIKERSFTAEKQLELIKWMVNTNHRYFLLDVEENDFEGSLAKVFNLYWQDLTDIEKEQIKEILNE